MAISIRAAVEEDYGALCEIISQVDALHRERLPQRFRASQGPARTLPFVLNAINDPEIGLFVAETEDSLAGFVHVIIKETPDIPIFVPRRYAVVDGIAVKEQDRRAGIGRALMIEAHRWAMDNGATTIELNVYAFNQPAVAFYRQLGYNVLSHRMLKPLYSLETESEDN